MIVDISLVSHLTVIFDNIMIISYFTISSSQICHAAIGTNFACRIVSGIRKYDHVTPELQRLRWLPVSSQLYYRNAILAFKCMYGRAPEYLSTFFTKRCDVNRYTTRSSQLLNVPLFKTASGQRTFYYRTVSIWNSLESFLKLSSNESIFKKRLRSKLLRDFLGCD